MPAPPLIFLDPIATAIIVKIIVEKGFASLLCFLHVFVSSCGSSDRPKDRPSARAPAPRRAARARERLDREHLHARRGRRVAVEHLLEPPLQLDIGGRTQIPRRRDGLRSGERDKHRGAAPEEGGHLSGS